MQRKTRRPVQFELTEQTREAVQAWIAQAKLTGDQFLFPSRLHASPHLSTRQYAKIVDAWVSSIGLDPNEYGTHTMRRTKATLIYRRTKNLRAVQLLLGHTKLESTRSISGNRSRRRARDCRTNGRIGPRRIAGDAGGRKPGQKRSSAWFPKSRRSMACVGSMTCCNHAGLADRACLGDNDNSRLS